MGGSYKVGDQVFPETAEGLAAATAHAQKTARPLQEGPGLAWWHHVQNQEPAYLSKTAGVQEDTPGTPLGLNAIHMQGFHDELRKIASSPPIQSGFRGPASPAQAKRWPAGGSLKDAIKQDPNSKELGHAFNAFKKDTGKSINAVGDNYAAIQAGVKRHRKTLPFVTKTRNPVKPPTSGTRAPSPTPTQVKPVVTKVRNPRSI